MSKDYDMGYYLESQDISYIYKNYHQAYLQHYPNHAEANALPQKDDRFWINDANELIFYAGEQLLLDHHSENAEPQQYLGQSLYTANLTVAARFLEFNIPTMDFSALHIMLLPNHNRGHWTSVVLSIEDLNKERYQEIYGAYQDFKKFAEETYFISPEDLGPATPGLFIQYFTENLSGGAAVLKSSQMRNVINAYFVSKGKRDVLAEFKTKHTAEMTSNPRKVVEGNLQLVLASRNDKNTNFYHFDSWPRDSQHERIRSVSERFLERNHIKYAWPQNISTQTGATCGEHAIINALRYALFKLTSVVPSRDLRTATNHFCPALAKLFLFDYDSNTYTDKFNEALETQIALESVEQEIKKQESSKQEKSKEKPTDRGKFLAFGMVMGVGLSLFTGNILAPALGILRPFFVNLFSAIVGLFFSAVAYAFIEEEDKKEENKNEEPISEEQKMLEKQSAEVAAAAKQKTGQIFVPRYTSSSSANDTNPETETPQECLKKIENKG